MNTFPEMGKGLLAANWLLANANPKVASDPMTSPVDRISGPRRMSIPGNRLNGKTLSLIE
jgi:hypothetical protein